MISVYNDVVYRSKFEAKVAQSLTEAGVRFRYEPEAVKWCDDGKEFVYIPDFWLANDTVIEAKGFLGVETRRKYLSLLQHKPQLKLKLLFLRNCWLNTSRTEKYTDWCRRQNIDCSVGTEIPQEWLG